VQQNNQSGHIPGFECSVTPRYLGILQVRHLQPRPDQRLFGDTSRNGTQRTLRRIKITEAFRNQQNYSASLI
jgi:hypothetical protein